MKTKERGMSSERGNAKAKERVTKKNAYSQKSVRKIIEVTFVWLMPLFCHFIWCFAVSSASVSLGGCCSPSFLVLSFCSSMKPSSCCAGVLKGLRQPRVLSVVLVILIGMALSAAIGLSSPFPIGGKRRSQERRVVERGSSLERHVFFCPLPSLPVTSFMTPSSHLASPLLSPLLSPLRTQETELREESESEHRHIVVIIVPFSCSARRQCSFWQRQDRSRMTGEFTVAIFLFSVLSIFFVGFLSTDAKLRNSSKARGVMQAGSNALKDYLTFAMFVVVLHTLFVWLSSIFPPVVSLLKVALLRRSHWLQFWVLMRTLFIPSPSMCLALMSSGIKNEKKWAEDIWCRMTVLRWQHPSVWRRGGNQPEDMNLFIISSVTSEALLSPTMRWSLCLFDFLSGIIENEPRASLFRSNLVGQKCDREGVWFGVLRDCIIYCNIACSSSSSIRLSSPLACPIPFFPIHFCATFCFLSPVQFPYSAFRSCHVEYW